MGTSAADEGDLGTFVAAQWDGDWAVNRTEPFPEQYDTFVGSAASLYHLAPTPLNREHPEREGYPAAVDGDGRPEFEYL